MSGMTSDKTESQQSHQSRGRHAESVSDMTRSGWRDVVGRVIKEFEDDKVVLLSAGVAFFFFLALIPALAAGISVYALVARPSQIIQQAQQFLAGSPPQISEFLISQMERMSTEAGQALGWSALAGILFALWSASTGTARLIEAVNVAYDERDDRGFLHRRGVALIWTVGLLALAVGGLVVGNLVFSALRSPDLTPWARVAGTTVFWVGLAVIMALGLAVLYRYAPYRAEPKWRWVSWGSVVAVVLWVGATLAFRLYVSNFGNYNEIYGSLGAVIVFMLWLLITAVIIILGAEINSELEHQTRVDTTTGSEAAMGERDAYVADTLGDTQESFPFGNHGPSADA